MSAVLLRKSTDQTTGEAPIVRDMHSVTAPAQLLLPTGEWRLDLDRSRLGFSVEKLAFGTVRGRFRDAAASVTVTPEQTVATGSIRVAGIDTGDERRDAHLRGEGFFDALQYPKISFRTSVVEPIGHRWLTTAELTIRDVTRAVELVVHAGQSPDVEYRRLLVYGEIDRFDFGVRWNRAIEATGTVARIVRVAFDLTLARAATELRGRDRP
jgi:polyisoprenoid-binding protein YceI